ncbi:ABC transporter permease [Allorhodopirellula solitaria]|uniref:FtsX-like permease family protein n=1 Tax=Allorhodopirellula solitaria TaxID=2527987 RepID=A0A5C5YDU7_9BACT|nr:ABC transporter permease [Allorhodopirellula solitaria]TWT72983.1 FtsX-like permease family protein [Allorhodopirellula solitaria]
MAHTPRSFSLFSVIRATLRYRSAITLAVALGVATATAVITGALLVGDSMRSSLRALTVERLGRIESILAPGQFFPIDRVEVSGGSISASDKSAVSVILFPGGSVETKIIKPLEPAADAEPPSGLPRIRHVGGVQIVGADESFWDLDVSGVRPDVMPGETSVVLNQSAADELEVSVGDEVTLRLPVEAAVPADSPLGKREIQGEGLPRMEVVAIVPDRGLGRFSLTASQSAPKTVFVSREVVADVLDRPGQANAILFDHPLDADAVALNLETLRWNLQRVEPGPAVDYISLSSDNLLLSQAAVDRIKESLPPGDVTEVMTYLANAIEREAEPEKVSDTIVSDTIVASVPYSTISAIDSGPTLQLDFRPPEGMSLEDRIPIVLNRWAADRLGVEVGAAVQVHYYEPEVERGKEVEHSFAAVLTQIVPLTPRAGPYRPGRPGDYDEPITAYNDPNLTPEVPGVTDQASIGDWDLPFALERKIEPEDDQYWNEHGLTPKAFIPLAAGQNRFGSRFGETTSLRISPEYDLAELESMITAAIAPIRADLGWVPRSIRSEQLAASKGTTPFDGLFLALSMFVIFAAMMLIALLLRLGMLQRIDEFGTLLAVGFSPRRVMGLVLGESAITSTVGVLIGLVGGVGYAAFVLWALRSWWVGAVTVPFLRFHATPLSIVLGGVGGWLVCMATAAWTLRFLLRLNPAALLGGHRVSDKTNPADASRWWDRVRVRPVAMGLLVLLAMGAAAAGARGSAQAAAGGFVGAGMLLLIASLLGIYGWLARRRTMRLSLPALATANAQRNPLRSTLTIGLVATAAFLILSITAFRMSPSEEGTGGFDLIAEAGTPISLDLHDPVVREDLLGRDAESLTEATIVTCRMRSGEDASCNNLYQATRPTVLGIPAKSDLESFGWAASGADAGEAPWQLLERPASGTMDDPIPVVIDQNTAMWSLQMTGGIGQEKTFDYGEGKSLTFQVVGLLAGSILQGKLMIGESNFEAAFPSESGYRYFLIRSGKGEDPETISAALESRLVDIGMDVKSAPQVLSGMLAVQNTYLRTFQSLGALGLLLGTIGLAISQLRSVLERRNELAVLRAVGFTRARLAKLVMGENFVLLILGMGCGVVTAILAVLPYAWMTGNSVPIAEPLWILLGILTFGMLAGLIAVWRVATLPLLESLRAEHAAIEL